MEPRIPLHQKHTKKKINTLWTSFTKSHLGNSQIWQDMPAVSRERPIWEKDSTKENNGKLRTNQNLQNGFFNPEEEEPSVRSEEQWLKMGDEYIQNPVSMTMNATLKQVVKEFVISDPVTVSDDSVQCDHLNEIRKRKRGQVEAVNKEEAEAAPNLSYAFIKNRTTNSEEKYVQLQIINERFMSTIVGLEEKEDKVYTLSCGFRTKRRYLYEI